MGIITFTGPYHLINKKAAAASKYPPVIVKMLTDPRTIGTYKPNPVFVHVGQKVTWINDSNADHTVDARHGPFHSGNVPVGSSYTWVPKKPGTYPYYCVYHLLMLGTLVVLRPGQSVANARQHLPKATPQPTTATTAQSAMKASQILSVDKAAKHVVVTMIAAATNANNGFNFDGYSKGAATFTIPVGWSVEFKFSNDQPVPHSLALATSHGSSPTLAKFNGSTVSTPRPTSGVPKGHTQIVRFTATKAGHYFVVCDVPGHAVAGMWDTFTISSSAATPTVHLSGS